MTSSENVKVWDIAVRLFHWSLVLSFIIAYVSSEELDELHEISGYVVLALVLFRIIWGFVGSKHARFSDFIYSPGTAISYVKSLREKKPAHYLGHNPLGGYMIVALIVCMLGISWTGLKLLAVAEGEGPLAKTDISLITPAMAHDDEGEMKASGKAKTKEQKEAEHFWEEWHEGIVNFTLLLIFLHLVGVFTGSKAHGENLARAMVTGYKKSK